MSNVKVRGFKKLYEGAVLPQRSTKYSAGYDLHALEPVVIPPGECRLIKTGLTAYMLPNEQLEIRPRSGLALKYKITVLNTPGTIDKDYEGKEIGVLLFNHSAVDFEIHIHDRIAQSVFMPFLVADNDQAEGERQGGFGSTGHN